MLPQAFTERMRELMGEEYPTFLAAMEQEPCQALRVNALKRANDGASAARHSPGDNVTRVSWEPNGYYYDAEKRPGKHPWHEAGLYYIQEPSAMAPVSFLEARPGDRVLDLCAAPGGKSSQIASSLQGEGLLVCNEIHPARARILSENIERMGVRNACVLNEEPTRLSEQFPGYFDRILVDAPCSGEGMFRKNEEARAQWSPRNVELCAKRQDGILDCAARMLRPGGRLVYSTCTFAPREDEGSVERFLARHPEFAPVPIPAERLAAFGYADGDHGLLAGTYSTEAARCMLRLWPHRVKGEGHFLAVLEKEGGTADGYVPMAAGGLEPGINPKAKELEPMREFLDETLMASARRWLLRNLCGECALTGARDHIARDGGSRHPTDCAKGGEPVKLLRFGDNLYLAPESLFSLKSLKVLRPGLQLGTLKKNRFEPSHALALALSPSDARYTCCFPPDSDTIRDYLNGMTFPYEGDKGWYLVCVDGPEGTDEYSLGWGKFAAGVMKNHYPKGLRKQVQLKQN